jgi:hypothetical protein
VVLDFDGVLFAQLRVVQHEQAVLVLERQKLGCRRVAGLCKITQRQCSIEMQCCDVQVAENNVHLLVEHNRVAESGSLDVQEQLVLFLDVQFLRL